jgi:ATP synthase protein I
MWRIAGSAGAVGIEIVLAIVVGYLGGQWLDGRLGTGPWLKWLGMAAGVGAAVKVLMRVVKQYNRSVQEDDSKDAKH